MPMLHRIRVIILCPVEESVMNRRLTLDGVLNFEMSGAS